MAGRGPNKGRKGDPIFDAFYATQVETVVSNEETQRRNREAGAALLDNRARDRAHALAVGPFGWLIADARPALVRAIVAIEPSGPPFEATIIGTGKTREFGLTDIAISYDPPIAAASDLAIEREVGPDGPDLFMCWMQKAPARQLVNLRGFPTVIDGRGFYHQVYDHCTAKYLNQAAKAQFIRLQDKGILGNGHMMMLEKNNLEIARLIDEWMQENVR